MQTSPCLPRETFEDSKWCSQDLGSCEGPLGGRFHLVLVFYLHHLCEYVHYKININAKMLNFLCHNMLQKGETVKLYLGLMSVLGAINQPHQIASSTHDAAVPGSSHTTNASPPSSSTFKRMHHLSDNGLLPSVPFKEGALRYDLQ